MTGLQIAVLPMTGHLAGLSFTLLPIAGLDEPDVVGVRMDCGPNDVYWL